MTRKAFSLLFVFILVLFLASAAGAQEPQGHERPEMRHKDLQGMQMPVPRQGATPEGVLGGPTTTATRWSDTFGDDVGLTSTYNTAAVNGEIVLGQIENLGSVPQGGSILALAVGTDGKIYLGTSGAYLNVYNPATGVVNGLGAPVPDECFG